MTETPDPGQQAGKLLSHVAGYVGVRTMEIGLRLGLIEAIAKHTDGIAAGALANELDLDPFYVRVWCRAACAAEVLEPIEPDAAEQYDSRTRSFDDDPSFRLAPHMHTLLLDTESPAYVGGIPRVMAQRELFDLFAEKLPTGERIWWDECSPEMIECVSGTGMPFYARMVPGGFAKIPGLEERLREGAAVAELCCGAGRGLAKIAEAYPETTLLGVDGDRYSLELAHKHLSERGAGDRAQLVHSPLEEMELTDQDVVFINISMHECRDIDRVTDNVRRGLKPGGMFVISDFPFPQTPSGWRSVPGRILSGIQFFEALIGDQLMPTAAFVHLLERHGFRDVGSFELSPVHAVTYGSK